MSFPRRVVTYVALSSQEAQGVTADDTFWSSLWGQTLFLGTAPSSQALLRHASESALKVFCGRTRRDRLKSREEAKSLHIHPPDPLRPRAFTFIHQTSSALTFFIQPDQTNPPLAWWRHNTPGEALPSTSPTPENLLWGRGGDRGGRLWKQPEACRWGGVEISPVDTYTQT